MTLSRLWHFNVTCRIGYIVLQTSAVVDAFGSVNPLKSRGNYSATSNNMKFVHWPLMGGLLQLV